MPCFQVSRSHYEVIKKKYGNTGSRHQSLGRESSARHRAKGKRTENPGGMGHRTQASGVRPLSTRSPHKTVQAIQQGDHVTKT